MLALRLCWYYDLGYFGKKNKIKADCHFTVYDVKLYVQNNA